MQLIAILVKQQILLRVLKLVFLILQKIGCLKDI